jgi:hypothetical protein
MVRLAARDEIERDALTACPKPEPCVAAVMSIRRSAATLV